MKIVKLAEPELVFKDSVSNYCKIGLEDSGPYESRKESHNSNIILGAIGPKFLVEKSKDWIARCNSKIESLPHGDKEEINKELFPDFPGFDIAFNSRLILNQSYIQHLTLSDFSRLNKLDQVKYTEELLLLIQEKLKFILENNESNPDVVLCLLSEEMYEICHVVGNYHRKLKKRKPIETNQLNLFQDIDFFDEKDFSFEDTEPFYKNFRSSLKKMAMRPDIGIPLQILREPTITLNDPTTQNAATKAWNFCTGIYYKSGKHPWILNQIDDKTCYLGISFYHKKDYYNDDVYTTMAHMFANDFDDIILRGEKVYYDEILGSPYLDYKKASELIKTVLSLYKKIKHHFPKRLVIHKTSIFRDDEIFGFAEILENDGIEYDLVTLKKASLRVIRYGTMPIPRGSMVEINDAHFLYTKGFISDLKTYPGVHVPAPFQVIKAKGDSSYKELYKEILALTKLNWNTADYCCGLPITIGFSRNVGQVLRSFEENDSFEPQRSYRFYM